MSKKKNHYYTKNKYHYCERILKVYFPESISKVKKILGNNYESTMKRIRQEHPFIEDFYNYAESFLKRYGVFEQHSVYQDCISIIYDSYEYSIHRYTVNNCKYISSYIKK